MERWEKEKALFRIRILTDLIFLNFFISSFLVKKIIELCKSVLSHFFLSLRADPPCWLGSLGPLLVFSCLEQGTMYRLFVVSC